MDKIIGKHIQMDNGDGTATQSYLDVTEKRMWSKKVELDSMDSQEWIEVPVENWKWDELWDLDYEYIMGLRKKRFDFVHIIREIDFQKK